MTGTSDIFFLKSLRNKIQLGVFVLTIGSEMEVLKGGQGRRHPLLVGKGGERLMVGHGMAERIMVSLVDSGSRKAKS